MTSRSSGTLRSASIITAREDGDAALEVDRAAAKHDAVLHDAGEGIDRPLLALDADDVGVRGEEESGAWSRCREVGR